MLDGGICRLPWAGARRLAGEEDTLTPVSAAEEIVSGLPAGRLVTIPAAGHLANLEAPDAFNQAVGEFLLTR